MKTRDRDEEARRLDALRERAERLGRSESPSPPGRQGGDESDKLIHELQTHQLELQLQNEELRKAQLELSEAHDRHVDLYDFAPVGYLTLNEKGVVLRVNLRLAEMLGTVREEMVGRKLSDYVASSDQEEYFVARRSLVGGRERHSFDLRLEKTDGSLLWTRGDWLRVVEKESGQTRLRATLSDVTEYKQLQAHLAQADRMSSVGLLAAGVAHEINNPLTYVLFSIENLVEDLPTLSDHLASLHHQLGSSRPACADTVERDLIDLIDQINAAKEGACRIRDIVKNLKVFSRPDDDRMTRVEVDKVLDSAVEMVRNELKYRAKLVKKFEKVPAILANDGRLCQVFLNILVNAAQAIEEGDVESNEVEVSLGCDDSMVIVTVRDTGEGIPPENLQKIFDPFYTTKDVGEGSGLGLSICRTIVSSHGGTIRAESVLGKGSRFVIRLPFLPHDRVGALPPPRLVEPVSATEVSGRVLIIDDEPSIGKTMAMVLGQHEVTVAEDGLEGQAVIEQGGDYDVILCDLMMPGLSGMELYAWLGEQHPELVSRVVFMTGAAFTPRARKLVEEAPNLCIEKPLESEALETLVQKLVLEARGEE